MGESHGLGHELLALKIVEVGDSGEAVKDQCRQLSILMMLAAFCHLNHRVGASALVAQDGYDLTDVDGIVRPEFRNNQISNCKCESNYWISSLE